MQSLIPLSIPNFEGNEKKYVDEAIEQGWVSTGGKYISEMEYHLERYLNVERVACVQSGTAALHLAMIEAGIGPEDIVLVPPLTFIAAVNPIKYQFATPVFIDCDDSFCLDPKKLKDFCEKECFFVNGQLLYKKRHVKAVVVVHVFGNLADMEGIMSVAHRYNLKVVEDATEALGSKYINGTFSGKYAGTVGDYGCYSFNGNKIITTGGGGAITAKDSTKVEHLRYLSTQAKDDAQFYIHNEVGYNYRMTNVQAAIGVAQLEELPQFIKRKKDNFNLYCDLFCDYRYAQMVNFREETESNYWFYSLKINRKYVHASMKEIVSALQKRGIQTRAIWGLISEQLPYQNEIKYQIERATYYSSRILNIPSSTQITEEEIKYVVKTIKEVLSSFVDLVEES